MQTACRIDDDCIQMFCFCMFNRLAGNFNRRQFCPFRKDWKRQLFTDCLKLLNCSRTVNIGCYQQWFTVVFSAQQIGEFSGSGRFTGSLQPDHHNDGWLFCGKFDFPFFAAHQFSQFIFNDFDDLLARSQAFHDILTNRAFADFLDEFFDDLQVDIRFD